MVAFKEAKNNLKQKTSGTKAIHGVFEFFRHLLGFCVREVRVPEYCCLATRRNKIRHIDNNANKV
jgi:hypothetical protein